MRVTFSKVDVRRYLIEIVREHGPALVPRHGPGNDDLMPHDLAHYLTEEQFGIELGVWGQLAAGGTGVFRPAPEDDSGRFRRTAQRVAAVGRDDMRRSEQLTALAVAMWERDIGRRKHQWSTFVGEVDAAQLKSAVRRLDDVSRRWASLQYGRGLTFEWPRELTVDFAKTHRGRRQSRRNPPAHPAAAVTRR